MCVGSGLGKEEVELGMELCGVVPLLDHLVVGQGDEGVVADADQSADLTALHLPDHFHHRCAGGREFGLLDPPDLADLSAMLLVRDRAAAGKEVGDGPGRGGPVSGTPGGLWGAGRFGDAGVPATGGGLRGCGRGFWWLGHPVTVGAYRVIGPVLQLGGVSPFARPARRTWAGPQRPSGDASMEEAVGRAHVSTTVAAAALTVASALFLLTVWGDARPPLQARSRGATAPPRGRAGDPGLYLRRGVGRVRGRPGGCGDRGRGGTAVTAAHGGGVSTRMWGGGPTDGEW